MNEDGFELKIACDKLANLCIESVSITEYNETCGIFAKAAKSIAQECSDLDGDVVYISGFLHDIRRIEGRMQMRHSMCGYSFLSQRGYDDAARIALTHSFVIPDIRVYAGQPDCTDNELALIKNYLDNVIYNNYDKLIQLCDAIALPEGVCLMRKG